MIQRVSCDNCKNVFEVKVQECKVEINNQNLMLSYFMCSQCNKIYRISLFDTRYFELKEDVEKAKKRIQRNRGNQNEEMARMLNQVVNKKLQRLRDHTDKLNKKFPGTFVLEVSENKEKIIKYLP